MTCCTPVWCFNILKISLKFHFKTPILSWSFWSSTAEFSFKNFTELVLPLIFSIFTGVDSKADNKYAWKLQLCTVSYNIIDGVCWLCLISVSLLFYILAYAGHRQYEYAAHMENYASVGQMVNFRECHAWESTFKWSFLVTMTCGQNSGDTNHWQQHRDHVEVTVDAAGSCHGHKMSVKCWCLEDKDIQLEHFSFWNIECPSWPSSLNSFTNCMAFNPTVPQNMAIGQSCLFLVKFGRAEIMTDNSMFNGIYTINLSR